MAAGQARLIVRHTAAAPAVDVRAGGKPVFEDLTNPKEAKADLPAGTVERRRGAGRHATPWRIGPADLDLKEGTATIVYAVGSAEDKTLDLVTQTITGLHSAPGGVPSGSGGQADRGLRCPGTPSAAAGPAGPARPRAAGCRAADDRRTPGAPRMGRGAPCSWPALGAC